MKRVSAESTPVGYQRPCYRFITALAAAALTLFMPKVARGQAPTRLEVAVGADVSPGAAATTPALYGSIGLALQSRHGVDGRLAVTGVLRDPSDPPSQGSATIIGVEVLPQARLNHLLTGLYLIGGAGAYWISGTPPASRGTEHAEGLGLSVGAGIHRPIGHMRIGIEGRCIMYGDNYLTSSYAVPIAVTLTF